MALQHGAQLALMIMTASAFSGCAQERPAAAYRMVATGSVESGVRVYRSAHYTLFTTLVDLGRVGPIMQTLEAGHAAYVTTTGVHPNADAPRMNAYVFQHRLEWEAFTRLHTGSAAPIYLRLHRGGYTYGDACAVVDQGERDTLSILAHEGFHLFIATRFEARPPPFIEEGLATTFESLLGSDGLPKTTFDPLAGRQRQVPKAVPDRTLRQLLSMHAGNVIGLSPSEVDAFYGHAWMFVRFCEIGEGGRHRAAFLRLLSDAAEGRLSSADLSGEAGLVERYLGVSLEDLEPRYRRFVSEQSLSTD